MQLVQADISLMTNYVSTENLSRRVSHHNSKLILNTEQNSLFIPVAKVSNNQFTIHSCSHISLLELFITHYIYKVIICYIALHRNRRLFSQVADFLVAVSLAFGVWTINSSISHTGSIS